MRTLLLFSFLLLAADVADAVPQRGGRATQPAGRSGIAITATDSSGGVLSGVTVDVTGPMTRSAQTDAAGQVSFPGLPAGTYRLRFTADAVDTLEREVTLRAGQVTRLDVKLTPATARPETMPPPAPTTVGPAGQPQVLSLVDLVERELIENDTPRKDTLVACSGNMRSMLVQLNEPQARRVYEGAEAAYYVIAGEGAITIAGGDVALAAGVYAALPRGVPHAIARTGRRPLILLALLSGEPCEVSK